MSKKLKYNDVKYFIEYDFSKKNKLQFTLLDDDYINSKIKMNIIDEYGYMYYASYCDILKNYNRDCCISRFEKRNIFTLENIDLFMKINGVEYITDKTIPYQGKSQKIKLISNYDENVIYRSWGLIKTNVGYGFGILDRISRTTKSYKEEIKELTDGAYEVVGEYINARTHTRIKHLECGTEFDITPEMFVNYYGRCPNCNKNRSCGETEINRVLKKYNIQFIEQYRFQECKNILPLPFDFYIESKNTCIEFQGLQHYKINSFFNNNSDKLTDEERFKKLKYRDKIKKDFCSNNNINLIEIKYNQIPKIESIINNLLIESEVQIGQLQNVV